MVIDILNYKWTDTLGLIIGIMFAVFMVVGFIAILINQFSDTKFRISNLKWRLNRKYNIRKDCIYCERAGLSDETMSNINADPYELIIPTNSDYDFQCSLFKYKLDKNFNCSNCKHYRTTKKRESIKEKSKNKITKE